MTMLVTMIMLIVFIVTMRTLGKKKKPCWNSGSTKSPQERQKTFDENKKRQQNEKVENKQEGEAEKEEEKK